jgi:hypothetical protein
MGQTQELLNTVRQFHMDVRLLARRADGAEPLGVPFAARVARVPAHEIPREKFNF